MLTRGSAAAPLRPDKELDELIGKVAESETFRTAPMMRTLLLYLWKHQGQPVSEYAIAVDALGRSTDFDPKSDSTVRVQVARLRAKLKDFYETAGESFPLKLSIPLGRHELTYTYTAPVRTTKLSVFRTMPSLLIWAAGGCLIAVLGLALALVWMQNRALTASVPAPLPSIWRTFVSSAKPSLVVVPSPLYFFWPDRRVYVRDLSISAFPNWTNSPVLRELGEKWGAPELAQTYVGAMEMSTGVRFLQYLDKQQAGAQLVESRKFSTDSFADRNIVFLGMPRTTAGYLDRLLDKTTFFMAQADPDVIRSRAKEDGPSLEFRETSYSTDRRVYPAMIVFLPKRPEGTRCILVLGRYLTGAASMLLTADGLRTLEAEHQKAGSPDAWEMVVDAETYRDTLLNIRARAFRPISANFWDESNSKSR